MTRQSNEEPSPDQALLQKYSVVQPNRSKILQRTVADTAYLVCESRARRTGISQDIYARDWLHEDRCQPVSDFWEEFSSEVYPYDDLEVSLRNRYWLEHLRDFIEESKNPMFVNIGAGFTSYPFLLSKSVPALEFDKPAVAGYKNTRIQELEQQGILPARKVACYPIDLESNEDIRQLKSILHHKCVTYSSFILCEGLTYYLKKSTINTLVDIIKSCQRKGATLGIDFWNPKVAKSPVFLRMKTFFSNHLGLDSGGYTFINNDWIVNIAGYETEELTTVAEQEIRFSGTTHLQNSANVLLESYAVLKRI